jgi:membrane protease YdiL (CAAX protease family)
VHRPSAVHGLTRRVAIAALVLPALLLVAIAARSYQPFGGDGGRRREASTPFLDGAFTVMFVLMVLAALIAVWAWLHAVKTRPKGKGRRAPYASLVVFLVIFAIAVVAGRGILEYKRRPEEAGGSDSGFPGQVVPKEPVQRLEEVRDPQIIWPLAIGIAILIVTAIVTAIVIERRRNRRESRTPAEREELARALDEAIDDLRRDPDPRRAVIAAYARMEQALTVYGLPRRPAEAPYEYLHRVARELEAEGPVASLTELFEVAKFSEHSVDESMRGRAIEALTAVRAEVRTAAT